MKLAIGESFLSIQGEGKHAGRIAVFVRLAGCNLDCIWCDSVKVWRHGKTHLAADFAKAIADHFYRPFQDGAMLILTGGEPLIPAYHRPLIVFLEELSCHLGFRPFVEVETNGTCAPNPDLNALIASYACSPKLGNSGMPKEKRITPNFSFFVHNPKAFFKFVVASWDDVQEVYSDFVIPFNLEPHRIWLMPCADNERTLRELAPQVAHWALKMGWNYSDRLQVRVWDRTTGV